MPYFLCTDHAQDIFERGHDVFHKAFNVLFGQSSDEFVAEEIENEHRLSIGDDWAEAAKISAIRSYRPSLDRKQRRILHDQLTASRSDWIQICHKRNCSVMFQFDRGCHINEHEIDREFASLSDIESIYLPRELDGTLKGTATLVCINRGAAQDLINMFKEVTWSDAEQFTLKSKTKPYDRKQKLLVHAANWLHEIRVLDKQEVLLYEANIEPGKLNEILYWFDQMTRFVNITASIVASATTSANLFPAEVQLELVALPRLSTGILFGICEVAESLLQSKEPLGDLDQDIHTSFQEFQERLQKIAGHDSASHQDAHAIFQNLKSIQKMLEAFEACQAKKNRNKGVSDSKAPNAAKPRFVTRHNQKAFVFTCFNQAHALKFRKMLPCPDTPNEVSMWSSAAGLHTQLWCKSAFASVKEHTVSIIARQDATYADVLMFLSGALVDGSNALTKICSYFKAPLTTCDSDAVEWLHVQGPSDKCDSPTVVMYKWKLWSVRFRHAVELKSTQELQNLVKRVSIAPQIRQPYPHHILNLVFVHDGKRHSQVVDRNFVFKALNFIPPNFTPEEGIQVYRERCPGDRYAPLFDGQSETISALFIAVKHSPAGVFWLISLFKDKFSEIQGSSASTRKEDVDALYSQVRRDLVDGKLKLDSSLVVTDETDPRFHPAFIPPGLFCLKLLSSQKVQRQCFADADGRTYEYRPKGHFYDHCVKQGRKVEMDENFMANLLMTDMLKDKEVKQNFMILFEHVKNAKVSSEDDSKKDCQDFWGRPFLVEGKNKATSLSAQEFLNVLALWQEPLFPPNIPTDFHTVTCHYCGCNYTLPESKYTSLTGDGRGVFCCIGHVSDTTISSKPVQNVIFQKIGKQKPETKPQDPALDKNLANLFREICHFESLLMLQMHAGFTSKLYFRSDDGQVSLFTLRVEFRRDQYEGPVHISFCIEGLAELLCVPVADSNASSSNASGGSDAQNSSSSAVPSSKADIKRTKIETSKNLLRHRKFIDGIKVSVSLSGQTKLFDCDTSLEPELDEKHYQHQKFCTCRLYGRLRHEDGDAAVEAKADAQAKTVAEGKAASEAKAASQAKAKAAAEANAKADIKKSSKNAKNEGFKLPAELMRRFMEPEYYDDHAPNFVYPRLCFTLTIPQQQHRNSGNPDVTDKYVAEISSYSLQEMWTSNFCDLMRAQSNLNTAEVLGRQVQKSESGSFSLGGSSNPVFSCFSDAERVELIKGASWLIHVYTTDNGIVFAELICDGWCESNITIDSKSQMSKITLKSRDSFSSTDCLDKAHRDLLPQFEAILSQPQPFKVDLSRDSIDKACLSICLAQTGDKGCKTNYQNALGELFSGPFNERQPSAESAKKFDAHLLDLALRIIRYKIETDGKSHMKVCVICSEVQNMFSEEARRPILKCIGDVR